MHDIVGKTSSTSLRWRKHPSKYDDLAAWLVCVRCFCWHRDVDVGSQLLTPLGCHSHHSPRLQGRCSFHRARYDWKWMLGMRLLLYQLQGQSTWWEGWGQWHLPSPSLVSVNPIWPLYLHCLSRSVPGTEFAGVQECWVSTATITSTSQWACFHLPEILYENGILAKGKSNSKTHWPKQLYC